MCNATFYIAFISCNICKRQALQTFHDIYTHDVRVSTATLSLVSPSCHNSTVLKFHTTRERQERWLVNNDFSGRVLLYMEAEAANGQPLLIEWAKEMHFRSTSDWTGLRGLRGNLWNSFSCQRLLSVSMQKMKSVITLGLLQNFIKAVVLMGVYLGLIH